MNEFLANSEWAAEQRDEADEGRIEAERSMLGVSCHGVAATKDHRGVVRPSQLIASVRWATGQNTRPPEERSPKRPKKGWRAQPTTTTEQFPAIAFGGVG